MTDLMYSCHNREKFPQQVYTILSSKPKRFCQFPIAVLKFKENFMHFENKDELRTFIISGVIDSEQCGDMNAWVSCFRKPFGN